MSYEEVVDTMTQYEFPPSSDEDIKEQVGCLGGWQQATPCFLLKVVTWRCKQRVASVLRCFAFRRLFSNALA